MSSTIKFLVDIGVGKRVEAILLSKGFDVSAVRDRDPSMADSKILEWAVNEQRIMATMDKEFGELVFRSGKSHAGVVLLRLEDASGDEKAKVMEEILADYSQELADRFSVHQDGRLRIRDV